MGLVRHTAGDARVVEVAGAQCRAVAHHQLVRRVVPQLRCQLLQRDGAVLGQPCHAAALRPEQGVVDLLPPRVHGADDQPVVVGGCPRHGRQRGYAAAGQLLCPRQTLGGRYADTQTRKAAGAVGHGDQPHVVQRQSRRVEHTVHKGHQRHAMGQASVLIGGGQHRAVFRDGGGHAFCRCLQRQYLQCVSPPVMVMMRSFSPSPRAMSTRMASSGNAPAACSDHSTAQTPFRAR